VLYPCYNSLMDKETLAQNYAIETNNKVIKLEKDHSHLIERVKVLEDARVRQIKLNTQLLAEDKVPQPKKKWFWQ